MVTASACGSEAGSSFPAQPSVGRLLSYYVLNRDDLPREWSVNQRDLKDDGVESSAFKTANEAVVNPPQCHLMINRSKSPLTSATFAVPDKKVLISSFATTDTPSVQQRRKSNTGECAVFTNSAETPFSPGAVHYITRSSPLKIPMPAGSPPLYGHRVVSEDTSKPVRNTHLEAFTDIGTAHITISTNGFDGSGIDPGTVAAIVQKFLRRVTA